MRPGDHKHDVQRHQRGFCVVEKFAADSLVTTSIPVHHVLLDVWFKMLAWHQRRLSAENNCTGQRSGGPTHLVGAADDGAEQRQQQHAAAVADDAVGHCARSSTAASDRGVARQHGHGFRGGRRTAAATIPGATSERLHTRPVADCASAERAAGADFSTNQCGAGTNFAATLPQQHTTTFDNGEWSYRVPYGRGLIV